MIPNRRSIPPHEVRAPSDDPASGATDRVSGRHPFFVVVHDVRSAFNVGSILRTSDALRAQEVILSGFSADGHHAGVHKSALGAQDTVPWIHVPTVDDALKRARGRGCTVAALEITGKPTAVTDLTLGHYPLCLVVGNEVDGVPRDVLEACDLAIEIPQFGHKGSLNVAVAFGIAGYDVVRHYRRLAGQPLPGPV